MQLAFKLNPGPARVAALYVDPTGPYQDLVRESYDQLRDARNYAGPWPVVAHPPCGPWGRFHWKCDQDPSLSLHGLEMVRRYGGILEHPEGSNLWREAGLPLPGELALDDPGRTVVVDQWWWGHRARKRTWLYMVGVGDLPPLPVPPATGPTVPVERMGKRERRLTPPAFARWLVEAAAGASRPR